jgi:hypothetical protein
VEQGARRRTLGRELGDGVVAALADDHVDLREPRGQIGDEGHDGDVGRRDQEVGSRERRPGHGEAGQDRMLLLAELEGGDGLVEEGLDAGETAAAQAGVTMLWSGMLRLGSSSAERMPCSPPVTTKSCWTAGASARSATPIDARRLMWPRPTVLSGWNKMLGKAAPPRSRGYMSLSEMLRTFAFALPAPCATVPLAEKRMPS